MGYIAVDLDGTLAQYDGWKGPLVIGEPVPKMLERVKAWLAEGKDVRIFTARVAPESLLNSNVTLAQVRDAIRGWCEKHVGRALPVTHEKDLYMIELWDDRATQVIANTGEALQDRYERQRVVLSGIAGIDYDLESPDRMAHQLLDAIAAAKTVV